MNKARTKATDTTLDRIRVALTSHYARSEPSKGVISHDELVEMLKNLPSLSIEEHIDTTMAQIQLHHPGTELTLEDYTTIAFVDDCFGQILSRTDLDFRIDAYLRDLAPYAALIALQENVLSITKAQPILSVLDILINECVGWSEDLGFLGEQFMEKAGVIVTALANQRIDAATALTQLSDYFDKEEQSFAKREAQLYEREMKVIEEQWARHHACMVLNNAMSGKQFSMFVIFFLQGSWYQFLYDVFCHYGDSSKQWKMTNKVTRALVAALQTESSGSDIDTLRHTILEQVKALADKLTFDTSALVGAMADIEGELEAIRSGNPSESCDFELLNVDDSLIDVEKAIGEKVLTQIQSLKPDQWFHYDNKHESEERVARIKLLVNQQDGGLLLFTNHNRRKIMPMTYTQFAESFGAGTIKQLSPKYTSNDIIRVHLVKTVNDFQAQVRREKEEKEAKQRRKLQQHYQQHRQKELSDADVQQKAQAESKHKRAMVLRRKADRKKALADDAVAGLRPNAWLKLPIMEGSMMPCKLAAVLPNGNHVFVNRAGAKIAEYSAGQLSNMLVTENSEILDTGAEFESVLASVVVGLRADKNKSFDELTGGSSGP